MSLPDRHGPATGRMLGVVVLCTALTAVAGLAWPQWLARHAGLAWLAIVLALVVGTLTFVGWRREGRSTSSDLLYGDTLTGLPNRRVLGFFLDRYFAAAQRGRPLALVLFDIDRFKEYNDRYGHPAGDEALKVLARILDSNTRSMDVSGRYSGEEFMALLPGGSAADAVTYAVRVRKAIEACDEFRGAGITVSAGVAAYVPTHQESDDLVGATNDALAAAKEGGGNRVMVYARPTGVTHPELAENAVASSADGALSADAKATLPRGAAASRGDGRNSRRRSD